MTLKSGRELAAFIVMVVLMARPGFCGDVQPVSPRPDLYDAGRGRSGILAARFPDKPAGLDQPRHVLSMAQGTGKALVLLIQFPGFSAAADHTPSAYQDMLFSRNTYATGSLNDYCMENSYGAFGVNGDVAGWYTAPQPYAFYVNGVQGFGPYPTNAQRLVEDVLVQADQDIDFSQYDGNSDGYIDALFVVHAGPGAEETGKASNIWSHAWDTSAPLTMDGVSVSSYAMEPEEHANGRLISIGVFCHELGHILGLPDLYDCDYSSDGVGNFCLMGSGSWGGDGRSPERPVHLCSWAKMRLGWITAETVATDLFAQPIQCYEQTPQVYRLWSSGRDGQEYFLVSNRQKTGFDEKLPRGGLLIWHVDETAVHNNDESHRLVDLEEADGNGHLDVYADFNRGDGGDVFPGTCNKRAWNGSSDPGSRSNGGSLTGIAVRNISDPASLMTADLLVMGEVYPEMTVTPTSVDELLNAEETVSVELTVHNSGNESLDFETGCPQGWLSIQPSSGSVNAGQSLSLTVVLKGSGLPCGVSHAELSVVKIAQAGESVVVPVSLTVEDRNIQVRIPMVFTFPADTGLFTIEIDNSGERSVLIGGVQATLVFDSTLLIPLAVEPTERSRHMDSFLWNSPRPGRLIILVSDMDGGVILPGTGPVACIRFATNGEARPGEGQWLTFQELVLSDERGRALPCEAGNGYILFGCKGDMNGDGCINIVDLVHVVNIILGSSSPTGGETWAADYNGDGTINIMDVVDMINTICPVSPSPSQFASVSSQIKMDSGRVQSDGQWVFPITIEHSEEISGLQIHLICDSDQFHFQNIIPAERTHGFETVWSLQGELLTVLLYSQEGRAIEPGEGPLCYLAGTNKAEISRKAVWIEDVLAADRHARNVQVEIVQNADLPEACLLSQNYPNPFNANTIIKFQIANPKSQMASRVTLRIFNILGQEVRTLVDGVQDPGAYTTLWDGLDNRGREVPSGSYFYRLESGEYGITQSMVLLR